LLARQFSAPGYRIAANYQSTRLRRESEVQSRLAARETEDGFGNDLMTSTGRRAFAERRESGQLAVQIAPGIA